MAPQVEGAWAQQGGRADMGTARRKSGSAANVAKAKGGNDSNERVFFKKKSRSNCMI